MFHSRNAEPCMKQPGVMVRGRAGASLKCLAVHLAECSMGKSFFLYISPT